MDINPQFFDECTTNYKQQQLDAREKQVHRDFAWQHLRETVLASTSDRSKLPANFDAPIPELAVVDVSIMEDDYSQDGDEQMSTEGPSISVDDQMMEDPDQSDEIQSYSDNQSYHGYSMQEPRARQQPHITNGPPSAAQGRVDHVRRKSVIPISADVMRE